MMRILLNHIKLNWNTFFAESYHDLAIYFLDKSDIKLRKANEAIDILDGILDDAERKIN